MSKTIETVYVYERAERGKSYDRTRNDVAFVNIGEEFVFFRLFGSVSFCPFRFKDNSLRTDDLLLSAVVFNFSALRRSVLPTNFQGP